MPGLTIGDTIPDLQVDTTQGKIKLHQFFSDKWTILFSHPGDFTPVCTTELGKIAQYASEFNKRGVLLLGLSCDDLESHKEWIKDIEAHTVSFFSYFSHACMFMLCFCIDMDVMNAARCKGELSNNF